MAGNLLLTLNTKLGPGGLASLQSGIQMVGEVIGKVRESIKAGQDYGVMLKELKINTDLADVATRHLIDTNALMKNALRLERAQIQLTDQSYADLSKVVTDHAQALRMDVTEAHNKFTEALVRGRTTGLKEYGFESKTVDGILKELTERAKDITIEYKTMEERIYAVNNNLGTLTNTILSNIPESSFLNTVLEDMSGLFADLTTEIGDKGIDGSFVHRLYNSQIGIAEWAMEARANAGTAMSVLRLGIQNLATDWLSYTGAVNDSVIAMMRLRTQQELQKATDPAVLKEQLDAIKNNAQAVRDAIQDTLGPLYAGAGKGVAEGGAPAGKGPRGKGKGREAPVEHMDFEQIYFDDLLDSAIDYQDITKLTNEELFIRLQAINMLADTEEEKRIRDADYWIEQQEKWEIERQQKLEDDEYAKRRQEYLDMFNASTEKSITFADHFGDAWARNLNRVTIEARMANTLFNAMHGTTEHLMRAIITGAPIGAKAIKNMISNMAFSESVYYAAQALAKFATGLYNSISPYGDKQEASAAFAAAAKYTAASAMFGGISAATGGPTGGASTGTGHSETTGGGYGSSGGYHGGDKEKKTEIVVNLNLDGTQIHQAVIEANDTASANGYSHFSKKG